MFCHEYLVWKKYLKQHLIFNHHSNLQDIAKTIQVNDSNANQFKKVHQKLFSITNGNLLKLIVICFVSNYLRLSGGERRAWCELRQGPLTLIDLSYFDRFLIITKQNSLVENYFNLHQTICPKRNPFIFSQFRRNIYNTSLCCLPTIGPMLFALQSVT